MRSFFVCFYFLLFIDSLIVYIYYFILFHIILFFMGGNLLLISVRLLYHPPFWVYAIDLLWLNDAICPGAIIGSCDGLLPTRWQVFNWTNWYILSPVPLRKQSIKFELCCKTSNSWECIRKIHCKITKTCDNSGHPVDHFAKCHVDFKISKIVIGHCCQQCTCYWHNNGQNLTQFVFLVKLYVKAQYVT